MSVVSVIIPTYNRAHLLGSTLESVLAQSFTDWECIVVDDGSTDATPELMEFYCLMDSRIQFFSRPQEKLKGASSCRNYGIEKAQGDFIQFLDSDDLISQNKFKEQIKLSYENPKCPLLISKWGRFKNGLKDALIFDDLEIYRNFETSYSYLDAISRSKGYVPLHAYLIKMEVIIKAGYWNEYLSLNDDGEFMIRIIANSENILFSEACTAFYRFSSNSNLSLYTDKAKVTAAVYSWKLIENFLKIRYEKDVIPYLENAKDGVYINLKKSFPSLIDENKCFFEKQRNSDIKLEKWYGNEFNRIKSFFKGWS